MKTETKSRIGEVMEEAIRKRETAGMNLLIIKDGEKVFFDTRGYANEEEGVPFARDSIVRLFSMSKPVTSAAAMILMERGLLDLAAPVSELLPGFDGSRVYENGTIRQVEKPMSVFHLLNMTAGLTYGDMETETGRSTLSYLGRCQAVSESEQAVSTRQFAIGLGQIPLAFEPDSSWCYSLCADVLGAVIEEVTGRSFGTFLEEEIFRPLGMEDTGFYVPAEKQARLADAYITRGPGRLDPYRSENLVISYSMDRPPAFESGGAGLVSTVDDYARFAQMLLRGGELDGVRILRPQTVAFMTGGRLTAPQQAAMRKHFGLECFTYSNLLRIQDPLLGNYPGLYRPGEYGWDGWMGCYFANFPQERVTMVLTQQKAESGTVDFTRKIRNVLLTDEEVFYA